MLNGEVTLPSHFSAGRISFCLQGVYDVLWSLNILIESQSYMGPSMNRGALEFGHLHGQDAHATWHGRPARVRPGLWSGPTLSP